MFYAQPSVAPACLRLQDDFGADVNVMLFGLYAARSRRVLSPGDYDHLDGQCRRWRDTVVRPLRAARRALKDIPGSGVESTDDLRKRVAQAELEAERLQQMRLEVIGAALGNVADATECLREVALDNLQAYAATCWSGEFDPEISECLASSLTRMGD